jgi:hypothetical protein
VIDLDSRQHVDEFLRHFGIKGIELLRPVQLDDAGAFFDAHQ